MNFTEISKTSIRIYFRKCIWAVIYDYLLKVFVVSLDLGTAVLKYNRSSYLWYILDETEGYAYDRLYTWNQSAVSVYGNWIIEIGGNRPPEGGRSCHNNERCHWPIKEGGWIG